MSKNTIIMLTILTLALYGSQIFGQDLDKDKEKVKACGTKDVDYKADTDKKQHPTPEAPADMALVYVLRPTMVGNKVQSKVAVDGEWKGTNRGNNYFFFTVEPGERYFCSQSENQDYVKLKVEAGKTYYLQQKVKMGFMKARTDIVVMTDEEGRKKLSDVHLSIFEIKK